MKTVYIALGSNIGDKVGYIQQAYKMLKFTHDIEALDFSSLYETEPYGNKNQEWFVNAILKVETSLGAEELLYECMRIENQLGRSRNPKDKWGPRTIDIDILFYDNEIIATEKLTIPHPELHQRAFVLVPMLELNDEYVHPIIGKTISQLHDELEEPEEVYLYGTRIKGL